MVIKLNGGLGTGMGLQGPKSLLAVRDGVNFLDLMVRQILDLRKTSGANVQIAADEQLQHQRRTRWRIWNAIGPMAWRTRRKSS